MGVPAFSAGKRSVRFAGMALPVININGLQGTSPNGLVPCKPAPPYLYSVSQFEAYSDRGMSNEKL